MYRLEPTKPAGSMMLLPTLDESTSPRRKESQICLYSSLRRVVWCLLNHHSRACSMVKKASTTYCWNNHPPSRGVIPLFKLVKNWICISVGNISLKYYYLDSNALVTCVSSILSLILIPSCDAFFSQDNHTAVEYGIHHHHEEIKEETAGPLI